MYSTQDYTQTQHLENVIHPTILSFPPYVPEATSLLPCQRHCIAIELNFLASEFHSIFWVKIS